METPLSPLEFMRRARRLYAGREAVVHGDVRRTYAQFFARCDRWSAARQALAGNLGERIFAGDRGRVDRRVFVLQSGVDVAVDPFARSKNDLLDGAHVRRVGAQQLVQLRHRGRKRRELLRGGYELFSVNSELKHQLIVPST